MGCAARSFMVSRLRTGLVRSGLRMPWSCRSVIGPDACVRPIIATVRPAVRLVTRKGRNAE